MNIAFFALALTLVGTALYVGGLAAMTIVVSPAAVGIVLFVALVGAVVMAPAIVLTFDRNT